MDDRSCGYRILSPHRNKEGKRRRRRLLHKSVPHILSAQSALNRIYKNHNGIERLGHLELQAFFLEKESAGEMEGDEEAITRLALRLGCDFVCAMVWCLLS